MDVSDINRTLFSRIQSLDPENATAIMAYLFQQSNVDDEDLLELAFSSDAFLEAVILKFKRDLCMPLHQPFHSSDFSNQNLQEHAYLSFNHSSLYQNAPLHSKEYQNRHQFELNAPEKRSFLHPDVPEISTGVKIHVDSFNTRSTSRNPGHLPAYPENNSVSTQKPCLFYARGYCKHGNSCRFLHIHSQSDGQRDARNDGCLSPESLRRLELELKELLREQKAPVTIASLPQLYYEKFGKLLQAEGYLTESQRHGKAGHSLTKLLARLKNTIAIINRPHGQHAVVLAEGAHLYREDADDVDAENPASCQIYMTFPPDSIFSEQDVSDYFRTFGPVQGVRIPYQQQRMFGFVTFQCSETVKVILAKRNPHNICGARVLVKPYKEKGKNTEREISVTGEHSRFILNHEVDERENHFFPDYRHVDGRALIMETENEQRKQLLEWERRWLVEMHLIDIKRKHSEIMTSNGQAPQAHDAPALNGFYQSDQLQKAPVDTHQPHASTKFEYLLDVFDGEKAHELESKEKGDLQSEHKLLGRFFTSHHNQIESEAITLSEKMKKLSLDRRDSRSVHPPAFLEGNGEYLCHICMGCSIDPVELECKHMFCLQCILKVIRISKDECPTCQQHIESQIVKLLKTKSFQSSAAPFATGVGSQTKW